MHSKALGFSVSLPPSIQENHWATTHSKTISKEFLCCCSYQVLCAINWTIPVWRAYLVTLFMHDNSLFIYIENIYLKIYYVFDMYPGIYKKYQIWLEGPKNLFKKFGTMRNRICHGSISRHPQKRFLHRCSFVIEVPMHVIPRVEGNWACECISDSIATILFSYAYLHSCAKYPLKGL